MRITNRRALLIIFTLVFIALLVLTCFYCHVYDYGNIRTLNEKIYGTLPLPMGFITLIFAIIGTRILDKTKNGYTTFIALCSECIIAIVVIVCSIFFTKAIWYYATVNAFYCKPIGIFFLLLSITSAAYLCAASLDLSIRLRFLLSDSKKKDNMTAKNRK